MFLRELSFCNSATLVIISIYVIFFSEGSKGFLFLYGVFGDGKLLDLNNEVYQDYMQIISKNPTIKITNTSIPYSVEITPLPEDAEPGFEIEAWYECDGARAFEGQIFTEIRTTTVTIFFLFSNLGG